METWAIKHFNSYNNGYNCTLGGEHGCLGYKHTEEAKEKIRQSKIGNKSRLGLFHTEETKKKMSKAQKGKSKDPESIRKMSETKKNPKLFDVYKDLKHIGTYSNITKCAKGLGIPRNQIMDCLTKRKNSYKEYCFIYNGKTTISKLSEKHKLKCAISHGAKTFQVFTQEGQYIGEWTNQSQCARELNLDCSKINKCLQLNSGYNSHKGYIFKHKENKEL